MTPKMDPSTSARTVSSGGRWSGGTNDWNSGTDCLPKMQTESSGLPEPKKFKAWNQVCVRSGNPNPQCRQCRVAVITSAELPRRDRGAIYCIAGVTDKTTDLT